MKKYLFALLFSSLLFSSQAYANDDALNALKNSTNQLISIISDPNYNLPEFHEKLRADAENTVMDLFDFEEFSTRTVGKPWQNFTDDQKARFIDAFTQLLRNTYLSSLNDYSGETIEYGTVIEGNNGTRVEIRTNVVTSTKKIPLAFRMLEKSGKWVVYDVLVENISLIKNYREQFAGILAKSTPDELILKVEETAQDILKKNS